MRYHWLLMLASAAACVEASNDDARERLASALKERLGEAADPRVAFQRDSTHLLVRLATVAFATVSEGMLTDQARSIGRLALRHYEKPSQLDSVTVRYSEKAAPGVWHIRHERTFPVDMLRDK